MYDELQNALDRICDGAKPSELESETLDFKQDARNPKETMKRLASAALCFANAAGGSIVVGVADDVPGPAAFVGTDLDPLKVKESIYDWPPPNPASSSRPQSRETGASPPSGCGPRR